MKHVVIIEEQSVETQGPEGICIFANGKETSKNMLFEITSDEPLKWF